MASTTTPAWVRSLTISAPAPTTRARHTTAVASQVARRVRIIASPAAEQSTNSGTTAAAYLLA
ncbi:MAG: hypothetical protein R2789_00495 [Microthrixaceae bacterium]